MDPHRVHKAVEFARMSGAFSRVMNRPVLASIVGLVLNQGVAFSIAVQQRKKIYAALGERYTIPEVQAFLRKTSSQGGCSLTIHQQKCLQGLFALLANDHRMEALSSSSSSS